MKAEGGSLGLVCLHSRSLLSWRLRVEKHDRRVRKEAGSLRPRTGVCAGGAGCSAEGDGDGYPGRRRSWNSRRAMGY